MSIYFFIAFSHYIYIYSYTRANLGDRSPYEMFAIIYGEDILKKMGAEPVPANDIVLLPSLIK